MTNYSGKCFNQSLGFDEAHKLLKEIKEIVKEKGYARIVSSAIKCNGKIYVGARHHIILQAYNHAEPDIRNGEQGFVDNYGLFYNRAEAKDLAVANGQVKETRYKELYSEDLW